MPQHKFVYRLVRLLPFIGFLLAAACASGQAGGGSSAPASHTYFIFDTIVTVRVYDERMSRAHFDEVERLLERIDERMNRQRDGSEIDRVNRQAGVRAVEVSDETFHVVSAALDYARSSGGRFDPTVGPLVDLWGIGSEAAAIPAKDRLERAIGSVGYEDVRLLAENRAILLTKAGMSLDLGAIAKGYAADAIKAYLADNGFAGAIIDLGGNVVAMGEKPGGSAWSIGIQDPAEQRGEHLGILRVRDKTIVTSGIYERYFKEDGVVYHHILDTATGYPVSNGLLSVTIVTDVSMDADALSTAAFALGLEDGMRYVESLGSPEAIFVTTGKQIYTTSGLKDRFELTNDGYTLP